MRFRNTTHRRQNTNDRFGTLQSHSTQTTNDKVRNGAFVETQPSQLRQQEADLTWNYGSQLVEVDIQHHQLCQTTDLICWNWRSQRPEILLSWFLTSTKQMECHHPLNPKFLEKYKKYTPGSTNIENVIGNVIDFLYFLCTFESTKPGNKSTWFPGSCE